MHSGRGLAPNSQAVFVCTVCECAVAPAHTSPSWFLLLVRAEPSVNCLHAPSLQPRLSADPGHGLSHRLDLLTVNASLSQALF